uniref:Uncharacterized protein n=1 Tax=Parascaris univalens TaxID=6257 RepID=A0A915CKD5_PARUN
MRRSTRFLWRFLVSVHSSILPRQRIWLDTAAWLHTSAAPPNQTLFCTRKQKSIVNDVKCGLSTAESKGNETSSDEGKSADPSLPPKELLFQIDWIFEVLVPAFMKAPIRSLLTVTNDDVVFEDRIFHYNFVGKSKLNAHVAKVRAYYRYLSPYNKVERLGSCIYEGEDVVVVLWRLSSLRSSFLSYLPKLFTKREDKMDVVEGAMDVHVTKDGRVYKIVNRKITASDLEGAKVMAEMKKEIDEESSQKERKKWVRELHDMMEKEATR